VLHDWAVVGDRPVGVCGGLVSAMALAFVVVVVGGGGSALRFGNLVGATVKKVILEGVIDCIAPSATPMVEGGGVYLSER
jgi:hypothetical protein